MAIHLYRDDDADLKHLEGRKIAVIGYGAQGRAQALCLRDSGIDVVVGLREGGKSWAIAQEDGFTPLPTAEAAAAANIVHLLVPDEAGRSIYENEVAPHLSEGNTLSFSHAFNLVFGFIQPPENIDVIMVAPKAPGTEERKRFLAGGGVPALINIHQDHTGKARDTVMAMGKAMGFTRAGLLECTAKEEALEDLFGEQAVICGGVAELIKAGFETLTNAGYPPEMAYFECLHEMKLIVDLLFEGGLTRMWDVVSNTAEYGGRTVGPYIIDQSVRDRMKHVLDKVENGTFAKEWIAEYDAGMPNMKQMRETEAKHPIEEVGEEIRALFEASNA